MNEPLNRKLNMGLVGGGQGSFIGKVHSIAGVLDKEMQLMESLTCDDIDGLIKDETITGGMIPKGE